MQSRLALLLIVLLSISLEAVYSAPPYKAAVAQFNGKPTNLPPGKAWSLRQKSLILGEYEVFVSNVGLRASCKRSGLTFIARAPLWNPIGFSTLSGNIWRPKKENFAPVNDMCKSLSMLGLPNIWLIPVEHIGRKEASGFTCDNFSTTQAWTKDQLKQYSQGLIQRTSPYAAEYQAANVSLPKPACQILEQIYGVPSCSLLPIRFTYKKMTHNTNIALETTSCQIATPPKNWLDLPVNLKAVKTFNELNMDKGAQAGAEDLFGR
ncbi:hypothetical protein KBI23_23300 [bacterium]|nr:hypothetical protein [bacterium]MBP9807797.1 hypothetical protein [bacterium]